MSEQSNHQDQQSDVKNKELRKIKQENLEDIIVKFFKSFLTAAGIKLILALMNNQLNIIKTVK